MCIRCLIGSIHNKNISPKHKQQRQHLPGHPAITVVPGTHSI
uniref:Uncharacterized protein n=1 Tax=Anguilla anguilla TaxID=7936 RepID=A0A0E9SUD1_ANGAN